MHVSKTNSKTKYIKSGGATPVSAWVWGTLNFSVAGLPKFMRGTHSTDGTIEMPRKMRRHITFT